MGPDLRVPGHGFVIQSHVVRRGAEETVQELILTALQEQLILITMHPRPAMRSPVAVANWSMMLVRTRFVGPRLMKPAGLRHADTDRTLVARHKMQKGDLH